MNKTQVKKYLALLMAVVLTMGAILPGNSVFASSTETDCAENETVVTASEQEDCEEKLELYDAEVRADLEQEEIAIAEANKLNIPHFPAIH